ncbi:Protein NETWORKED 1A [Camellia lanceoleosa]|nr:Protein NETWORKED 1A [Camellia lanceoleosa]
MKERVSFMETEIGGLKAQLFAYAPAIDSLRDNIASLEHNVLSPPELNVADNQEQKDVELVHYHEKRCQEPMEDHNSAIPNRILALQNLQTRMKAVEKVVTEEKKKRRNHGADDRCLSYGKAAEDGVVLIEHSKSHTSKQTNQQRMILRAEFEHAEHKNENHSLDLQVEKELGVDRLEVPTCSRAASGSNKKKILERLN